jgi:hypothetical protein
MGKSSISESYKPKKLKLSGPYHYNIIVNAARSVFNTPERASSKCPDDKLKSEG